MCECSKCKKLYPEYELQWVEQSREHHMHIIWTGRGPDPRKQEKKMEVICDNCLNYKKRVDP